jgi:DNA-binding MarR family transcriptional regulator
MQPLAGALLRLAWRGARERVLTIVAEHGFADLSAVHLAVLHYPPPDGVRPTELAERAQMTKQSMNYLLAELEKRGYIQRRSPAGGNRRLVFLTSRGWKAVEAIRSAMREVEREWVTRVGKRRYNDFLDVLSALAG